MNKTKSVKRALVMSVLALVVCVSMLVGTTFAWFTDSVTSGRNKIQSGNLDVQLFYADSAAKVAADQWTEVTSTTDAFGYNLWEPGFTKVVYFKVVNNGSLALQYQLKADVYAEVAGKNQANESFLLSDYLYTAVVDTTATRDSILAMTGVNFKNAIPMSSATLLESGKSAVVGLAIWMPTSVGNEANHNGTNVPSIEFGINLVATQAMKEADSFGTNYDQAAAFIGGVGHIDVTDGPNAYEVPITDTLGYKVGSAVAPKGAVAADATKLTVEIKETTYNGNITVAAGSESESFEVKVTGLKANNDVPVKIQLRIDTGIDPTTVKLYHYDTEIHCTYDPNSGYVTFESTTFSPFTIVYDKESEYVPPVVEESDLPVANVVNSSEYENVDLPWGSYGQWSPTEGLDSQLEAAYTFTCEETPAEAELNKYANWYCDFYVMLDKDLGENEIFLGGNYGSFGWVGFHNGELTLEANTEIPLLGSVTTNPWTYAQVASNVGTFICGVGDVDDALTGAKFTVMLRLTNPEDETDFYNVATIEYIFD